MNNQTMPPLWQEPSTDGGLAGSVANDGVAVCGRVDKRMNNTMANYSIGILKWTHRAYG